MGSPPKGWRDGAASKWLVQTEMYVSKYTSKGREPEFHY